MNRIGIFLDRDGTINEEVDFLRSPDNLRLIPTSADAIREANRLGWKVFVITNQSGIARGVLTEDLLKEIHQSLVAALERQHARIDAIYYCPHHPENGNAPYRRECDCRKPNTGMLAKAVKEFEIDLNQSFVIGDRMIDVQTGNNCGATSILVLTGYGKEELKLCRENNVHIGFVAENLYDAIQHVKNIVQQKQPSVC
ncbi:MAG: D-glycero-beta-D-manno-heptose 1,7-bisphosphate 7-phosphatase [Ignavibacteria bacterium]|nr:D-glycero-beta-D-manno-heptose 1,7-bisphosphate 7-phosphatase [Ignavibacteria bacterium]MBI3766479.1 D-glycero-beta-D-manno-heptose 1,7-bisphosphate 7-phosphatase [Ignavibacteriales bacterium]